MTASARAPFRALRVRNYQLYFGAQVGSNVGTWFQTLALSLLVLDLTHSGFALGLIPALQFGPALLLSSFAGAASDQVGARRVLVGANLAAGLAATALGLAAATHHLSLAWIYGTALMLGMALAVERPTSQAFLFELVGPTDLHNAIGLHSVTQSSARLIGPALGAAVYARFGAAACFFANGASYGLVVGALIAMRSSELHRRTRAEQGRGAFREVLGHVWRRPQLRAWLLVNTVVGVLAFNFMTTITAMVKFTLGGGSDAVGWAHSANAAGGVLGGLWAGSIRAPGRRHVLFACGAFGLTNLGNALSPSLGFFLLWAPLFGFTVSMYQTMLMGAIQHHCEQSMLGRVVALATMGSMGLLPLGNLAMGWIIDVWSARGALGLAAVGTLACAAWLAWGTRAAEPQSVAQPS